MSQTAVKIEKMVNGGYGLSHLPSGQVLLVQQALPEETIHVTIEETKKNYLVGKIDKIIDSHSGRISPPCQYYSQCGGCNLQHCQYSTQLEIKKSILEDLLTRERDVIFKDNLFPLNLPLASPSQFGYRQRIRLQIDDRGNFGFLRFRSHTIVPVKQCLLAAQEINTTLAQLSPHPESKRLAELAHEVEIQQNPGTGNTVIIFHLQRKPRPADIKSAKILCKDIDLVDRVFFTGKNFPFSGPYTHEDTAEPDNKLTCHYPALPPITEELVYSWEVGGFSQVNTRQNWNLIQSVVNFCKIEPGDHVLDLFCGMGNFSITLAHLAEEILGIEGQGSAIRSARQNASRANLTNTTFKKDNVHMVCKKLIEQGRSYDITVIDPPRQGVPGLSSNLAQLTHKQLIYISCDPSTLCRDIASLCNDGFCLEKIQPVDMFPHTHHLETIASLTKV